ncbi:hypothetical protein [Sporomusa sp.]|uniref:hypothetical protein n=1 Tax=Sporomusa sp. TaxID=2078658 RepID=UPI002B66D06C|nr:hypothetical protein [Sporomusa sp.]HWR42586.1 hypothetical protein [Sporomusa sp.]
MNRAIITLMCLGLTIDRGSNSSIERLFGDYIQEGRAVLRNTSKKVAAAFSDQNCYQCGCCCKEMPCIYGKWDEATHQCSYLEVAEESSQYNTYRCSQYDTIIREESSKKYPMFGGGCGRPLLNPDRDKIKQYKS